MQELVGAASVRRTRKAWRRLAGVLTLLGLLVAGCSNPADPGDRRLRALKADPALELVPPGARVVRKSWVPARKISLTEQYEGPSTGRTYRLSRPFEDALAFYLAELPALGWRFQRTEDDQTLFTKQFGDWEAEFRFAPDFVERDVLLVTMDGPPAKEHALGLSTQGTGPRG